ncbi:MAG: EamA family transporter [Bacteroidales bacterium]|nr:EamA family transporter [Bacteroidales bacterium]
MDRNKLIGHLAAAGAYTIFGLNIVFCKDIANSAAVTPVVLFTFRAIGASALFWALSLFLPREKVEKGDLPKIALAGFFGLFLTQMAFLLAIPMVTAIDTAILSTLGPIFTMFFAYLFLKEPITGKKAGGVALSFAGVLFLILNSVHKGGVSASSPWGIVLLLVNSLTFALYLGKFRPLIAKYSVVTFMKWAFLFCLLLVLPFSAKGLLETDYAAIPVNVRWEIGYLVFFATFVAYFLIPVGQKHLRPTLVSMYSYLQPILAAVVSIWAGLDVLTWQKCLATVLIVGGVILVSRSRSAAQRKRIEVVAAIIRKDGRIFATQRGYGDWKDWWEFPGGKMEPGETREQALVREIREELSADIRIDSFLRTVEWDYPAFHLTLHCYLCFLESEALHLNEHEAARWLSAGELSSVRWLPADEDLLPLIAAELA